MSAFKNLIIQGSSKLQGDVVISGSKNAALPMLIAVALNHGVVTLHNVPDITDIRLVCDMLERLNCNVIKDLQHNCIHFDCRDIHMNGSDIFEGASDIRASTLFVGALLGRFGGIELPLPGGDAIGKRPIDLHIKGFEALGARVEIDDKTASFYAPNGLIGAEIHLDFPSVGATENLMIGASYAKGKTILHGVAREPEILNLAELLSSMGVQIQGAGTSVIEIIGGSSFKDAEATVIPDRIELFTFLCAAGITGGNITCKNVFSNVLGAESTFLEQVGIELVWQGSHLNASIHQDGLRAFKLETGPFPAFSTDNQPMALVLATQAKGASYIHETMFENRYLHAGELIKMGANIVHDRTRFNIEGPSALTGSMVEIADIRAGACLVLAGLAAKGQTVLTNTHHILRGYQNMDQKFRALGADIYFE